MKEAEYQRQLFKKIEVLIPESIIIMNDATHIQGIPDITILYKNQWAMLELKRSTKAARRPNQEYYINRLNEMSFAAFINPDNEEEVLGDLQQAFGITRSARIP